MERLVEGVKNAIKAFQDPALAPLVKALKVRRQAVFAVGLPPSGARACGFGFATHTALFFLFFPRLAFVGIGTDRTEPGQ